MLPAHAHRPKAFLGNTMCCSGQGTHAVYSFSMKGSLMPTICAVSTSPCKVICSARSLLGVPQQQPPAEEQLHLDALLVCKRCSEHQPANASESCRMEPNTRYRAVYTVLLNRYSVHMGLS